MRAVRWHAAQDVRVEEMAVPELLPGTAIVEVAFCGLCGTDLHEYRHGPVMIRSGPHPLTGQRPPVTLGHEFSGRVIAIDATASSLAIGTRVAVDPCLSCGRCHACRRGDYHICSVGGSLGLSADGALARFARVPVGGLWAVPDAVSDEHAALAEPLAVGLHAATRAQVGLGDHVLVLGAGPIGLAALMGARAAGAGAVYVSEPNPARAATALAVGADEVFDPMIADVRREVFSRTGRVGPDAVIDGTGNPAAIDLGLRSLRRGGRMSIAGISPSDLRVDLRQLVLFERTLSGSLGYNFDIPRALDLIATGRIDPAPLLTDIRPIDAGPATLAELTTTSQHIKILLHP
jgi:(R,R)-butanediol dehydrogenase / meso-butanediol dehydrogenase / diacetyl reductase